jgi:DNA-binding NtrC family response regulator
MRPAKKFLNDYPAHGEDVSVSEFVMNRDAGLRRIVDFLNGWAREIPRIRDILVIRYEDMRTDPEGVLKKAVDFLGTPGSEAQVKEAVAFAAYENMKKLEEKEAFASSGRRLVPGDRKNPDSFKVRRAKVGGYRDYFDDDQITEIDRFVRESLSPIFEYQADGHVPDVAKPVQAAGA